MTSGPNASPYTMEEPPTSPGRALLARAFAHWCGLEWGFSEAEIAAAFDGAPDAEPDLVQRVANATRLLGEVMAAGRIRTWARPIGGGIPQPVDAALWELDDYRARMASSAMSLDRPFDAQAVPSHWIFVQLEDFNALVEDVVGATVPGRTPPAAKQPAADAADAATRPAELARPERHIRLREVIERTGMSRSTLYDRIAKGRFPATVPMEGNIAAWRETEVDEWLANPR